MVQLAWPPCVWWMHIPSLGTPECTVRQPVVLGMLELPEAAIAQTVPRAAVPGSADIDRPNPLVPVPPRRPAVLLHPTRDSMTPRTLAVHEAAAWRPVPQSRCMRTAAAPQLRCAARTQPPAGRWRLSRTYCSPRASPATRIAAEKVPKVARSGSDQVPIQAARWQPCGQ